MGRGVNVEFLYRVHRCISFPPLVILTAPRGFCLFAVFYIKTTHYKNRPFGVSTTALSAEGKSDEKDFEGDLKKLEKEAEEKLDAKIAELMSKIETTGAK